MRIRRVAVLLVDASEGVGRAGEDDEHPAVRCGVVGDIRLQTALRLERPLPRRSVEDRARSAATRGGLSEEDLVPRLLRVIRARVGDERGALRAADRKDERI